MAKKRAHNFKATPNMRESGLRQPRSGQGKAAQARRWKAKNGPVTTTRTGEDDRT